MKILKYIFIFLLPIIFNGCDSDEPNNPDNTTNSPIRQDPEQTITVSIYKNGEDNIDGLFIGADDYFTFSNPAKWFICRVGKINDLADIIEIPTSKWSLREKVQLGYGYIAYNRNTETFYRLYISNSAKDELGTITGYQIKYSTPFYGIDEPIVLTQTSASFDCDGGTTEIHYKNKSIIPVVVSSAPDWCEVSIGIPLNSDDGDIYDYYNSHGISIIVNKNMSSNPRTGIIELSTKFGKVTEITVSQEGKSLPVTTSILNLKKNYWNDNDYSCSTIINSSPVVIRGKVISSDECGNIYKELIIRDETSAISFSINAHNIYTNYKIGDDITIDLSGFSIGRYKGELQVGEPMIHVSYGNSISFLPYEKFIEHVIYNSSNNEIKPVITTINELNSAKSTSDGLQKWQSQFVQLNGVAFEEKNVPLASYGEATNRYIIDSNGHRLAVHTSGYANFYSQRTPSGTINISGIIHFNSQSGEWNLILIDTNSFTTI
ncbi:MAG: hypothetical protein K2M94_01240 [Paramuribaculum sp.]|nr:hypothetical protein [Paramuribaculum sp.]